MYFIVGGYEMRKYTTSNAITKAFLAAVIALGLTGCGNKNTANNSKPAVEQEAGSSEGSASSLSFTAGEYTATVEGRNGDVTVTAKFSDSAIESVTVGEHAETAGIADPAIERLPQAIVDGQTLKVDTVTGATLTSNAILEAVEDCVTQAGGDVEYLKANTIATEETEKEAEEYTTDIVIVGGGAAGLTSAISASDLGADVIVLEKGASTAVSNGANAGGPIAVGTNIQAEEGENLTIEELFTHMSEYANSTINDALLKNVLEVSGETINMFDDMGMDVYLRQDAYGVGFRARHGIREKGSDRMGFLEERITANGGTIMTETAGKELIVDADGNVVGIKAVKGDGTEVTIHAKAVVLATGGYLGSQEMIQEKFGNVTVNSLGNTLSVGDGIKMALSVGGREDDNWGIVANEFSAANEKAGQWTFDCNENLRFGIYGGLIVNQNGNRFFNEQVMANDPLSGAASALRQGTYYVVMDEAYYNSVCEKGIFETLGSPESWIAGVRNLSAEAPESRAHVKVLTKAKEQLQEAIDQGWAYKADTIAELAEYFGLDNLEDTVAAYNEMCANGKDTQFYKDEVFLTPVSEGPFYVFEYQTSAWCTLGGVKVDDSLRVVDSNNEPIKGLYAAGLDAGSMFTNPYYDNEGSALGLSFASGTLVGRNIVSDMETILK